MSSPRLWTGVPLFAALLTTWLASGASAQDTAGTGASSLTGGLRVFISRVDNKSVDKPGMVYLNLAQCRANVPVEFHVDGAPIDKPSIDIYRGENCNTTGRTDVAENRCTFIATKPGRISLGLLLTLNASELVPGGCDSNVDAKPKLWFLPVDDSGSAEAVNVYGVYQNLDTDTQPPDAPTNVSSGRGGENAITISWETNVGTGVLQGFKVYIDPNPAQPPIPVDAGAALPAADGGTETDGMGTPNPLCPSAVLIAGQSSENVPSDIPSKTVDRPNARQTVVNPSEEGIMDTRAAVSVVAVDVAGNRSPFSQVVCAEVVPTEDFWESYRRNGGRDVEGCPCTAMGPAQLHGALPIACVLLMLAVSARRRRVR